MQLPKVRRDLFISFPSLSLFPLFLAKTALSEPARSIKLNLEKLTSSEVPWTSSLCYTSTYKTA
jgi:hypothetical protein